MRGDAVGVIFSDRTLRVGVDECTFVDDDEEEEEEEEEVVEGVETFAWLATGLPTSISAMTLRNGVHTDSMQAKYENSITCVGPGLPRQRQPDACGVALAGLAE